MNCESRREESICCLTTIVPHCMICSYHNLHPLVLEMERKRRERMAAEAEKWNIADGDIDEDGGDSNMFEEEEDDGGYSVEDDSEQEDDEDILDLD